MFSRGIPLKLVSLCIALILTYAVQGGRNSSVVSLFIPIEVKNPPEDKVLVKPLRRGVQVTLKGPSFLIGPVASSPPPIKVKLPEVDDNRVTVSLSAADIALPSSVEVLGIEPSQMEFVFEAVEQNDVRVEVPRIGQLPKGLVLQRVEISPRVVAVRGARADLKQIKVLEAHPLDLSEIDSSTEVNLDLRIPHVSITPAIKSVVAKVVVSQEPTERVYAQREIELRLSSGAGDYEVAPSKVSVTLSGEPKALADLEEGRVVPFIRISERLQGGELAEKVQVDVPKEFTVVSVAPSSVMVRGRESSSARPGGRGK
jgi:YbbR domain-containing protein